MHDEVKDLHRSSWRRDYGRRHLLIVGLGSGRRSTVLAEIFVEISGREYKQKPFACRSCHSAGRTIEQRGIERPELARLFRDTRSWRSSCPRG